MHNRPLGKSENARQTPGKLIDPKPPLRPERRLVDPDQASVGKRARDLAILNRAVEQQVARLRCGPPEG